MATNNNQMQDILSFILGNNSGSGLDLSNILEMLSAMGEPKKKATERDTNINIPELMSQFRNEAYRPGGTGKVHFMGGSPFPQSPGQQRAEKVGATLGAGSNMLDAGSSIIASIMEALQKRKGQG